jgi:hypothetical protein
MIGDLGRRDMLVQPHGLTDRMSDRQQSEIFRLPVDAARCKVREIIDQGPQAGYVQVVENWRPLPDGQIEFTTRRLPAVN